MEINWNLIRCALGKHVYGEPIRNELLSRLVKLCVHCHKETTLSDDYNFKKFEEKKKEIMEAVADDNICHAKHLVDKMFKDFGYGL